LPAARPRHGPYRLCIDGLTWQALSPEHRHAKWIYTLFATVFDTATQASAWGYVASNKGGGLLAALAAGLVSTPGMVITDTLDGRIVFHVNSSSQAAGTWLRDRRVLGWLIVAISFGVALYNIGKALLPEIELDDLAFTLTGAALISLMAVIWAWLAHAHERPQPAVLRSTTQSLHAMTAHS